MKKSSIELVEGGRQPNISFNGRPLYSESSSPEKRVDGLPHASQALYIVLSPLLFYSADYLFKTISDDSAVLFIEADKDLYSFTRDYSPKMTSPSCLGYLNLDSIENSFLENLILKHRFRRIIPVKLNHGYMLNRKSYEIFIKSAVNVLESFWKNRMTTIHMGRLWCKNILNNLPFLPGAADISSLQTSKPVIVAGAGESLEKSIAFLKRYRGSFFLIAADTAVNSLLKHDLKPDLLIAVESQHANLYDFYNQESLNLPAAFDLTSTPELIRKHRGPSYFFISRFYPSHIFNILEQSNLLPTVIPPLGSVGISSIYIALQITQKAVYFTGLDFSFIPEKYHVSGAPSHILNMLNEKRTSKTGFFSTAYSSHRFSKTDKSGRTVFTDLVMESYSHSLRELIQISGRVFDIGQTGLASTATFLKNKELENIFAESYSSMTSEIYHTQIPASDKYKWRGTNVLELLKAEENKISKAIDAVIDFRNCEAQKSSSVIYGSTAEPEILRLLSAIDYTWLFFPDNEPLPSLSSSFLKRFLFSAAWFRNHIRNMIKLYQSSDLRTDKNAF